MQRGLIFVTTYHHLRRLPVGGCCGGPRRQLIFFYEGEARAEEKVAAVLGLALDPGDLGGGNDGRRHPRPATTSATPIPT